MSEAGRLRCSQGAHSAWERPTGAEPWLGVVGAGRTLPCPLSSAGGGLISLSETDSPVGSTLQQTDAGAVTEGGERGCEEQQVGVLPSLTGTVVESAPS